MMKRTLLTGIALFTLSFSACAQQNGAKNESTAIYTDSLEHDQELERTPQQEEKINAINKSTTSKFEAIGRNSSLSGYQKGQKKRELALQHKKEIFNVLTAEQQKNWLQKYGDERASIKDNVSDNADEALEKLENRYDADKKSIEDDHSLSKSEKKIRLEKLKVNYKNEKEKLKEAKEKATSSGLLQGR